MKARDRLLIAAARGYQEAVGMPPDDPAEARAKWMDQSMPAEVARGIEVTVTVNLQDLIEVTRAAKEVEYLQSALEREMEESNYVWRGWARARACFANDGRDWNERARAALREIGLLGKTKRKQSNQWLAERWRTLTDPNVGLPEGPRLSQRAALLLLAAQTRLTPGAIKKRLQRLQREGVNVTVRDP